MPVISLLIFQFRYKYIITPPVNLKGLYVTVLNVSGYDPGSVRYLTTTIPLPPDPPGLPGPLLDPAAPLPVLDWPG